MVTYLDWFPPDDMEQMTSEELEAHIEELLEKVSKDGQQG